MYRYADNLKEARNVGIKKGFINGIGFGCVMLVLYGTYALAFWYGSGLVRSREYDPGTLITVRHALTFGQTAAFNKHGNLITRQYEYGLIV